MTAPSAPDLRPPRPAASESREPPDPRSIRIAFLDSWKPSAHEGSGTAVGIAHLARGLERLGHRVDRLAPAGPSRGPLLPRRVLFNLAARRRMRREHAYDLVVGFDVDGFLLPRRPDLPFVLCLKGIAADEARFASGSARVALSLLARLEAENARRANRVVVPSRYSARVASERYGLSAAKVAVVPEPIPMEDWDRPTLRGLPRADRPTILSVAHQYPRKDTATLLRAVARVRRELPEVRLRVVGGGPELPALHALRAELGLKDAVRLDGAVADGEEVRRAYFQAHAFCLPSRQEGFGIVFLEAMAAGLPVVAARAAAVPEVVVEGETALLVPPGDSEALAAALLRVLTAPGLARRLGRAGSVRARTFDVEPVSRQFLRAIGFGVPDPSPGAAS